MRSGGPAIVYRRYRAPKHHGEIFADPPLADVPRALAENRNRQQRILGGPGWSEALFVDARQELIRLASHFTSQYRDVPNTPFSSELPILMAGHQPQLFHPGVWYKNFELNRLATSFNAVAISLIVDNDVVGHSSIRVLAGSIEKPRVENVAFDVSAEDVPFEEHQIQDRSLFDSFSARVQKHLGAFIQEPLLRTWWPAVVKAATVERNLGRALARARHELEGRWGLTTLELPLSVICDTNAFRRWMVHILMELPRFHEIYNRCLKEYRRVNHVRSRAHPAPELVADGDWFEAPFWLWAKEQPRRGRLFVRHNANQLELSDRGKLHFKLPVAGHESIVDAVTSSIENGIRLRPRALTTTMFVRLFLCDLFIHGIGGGKYDQLTDALIRDFFLVEPPQFLVLTATAKLPIPSLGVDPAHLLQLDWLLRDLQHNPDRYVDGIAEARPFCEEKRHWLASEAPRGFGQPRRLGIRQANAALQPFIAERRRELLIERERVAKAIRNDRLLGARDYAFCLFPEGTLQALLLDKK